jgi:Rrf2 family protein
MLKISEAVSLGIHACVIIAGHGADKTNVGKMAETLKASRAHLAKVMQRLVKAGLISSTRGPQGGFVLNNSPDRIRLKEIYEAIEGQLPEGECLFEKKVCGRANCPMGNLLRKINQEVNDYLTGTNIKDLI